MIQMQTMLRVADNSGAKLVRCINVLGPSNRRVGGIGDIIVGAVRKRLPTSDIEKGQIVRGVIVRTRKAHRRKDQLELEVLEPGEDPTYVSMPWILAECMLGNKVAAKELEKADGLRFSVRKDGGVELRVE